MNCDFFQISLLETRCGTLPRDHGTTLVVYGARNNTCHRTDAPPSPCLARPRPHHPMLKECGFHPLAQNLSTQRVTGGGSTGAHRPGLCPLARVLWACPTPPRPARPATRIHTSEYSAKFEKVSGGIWDKTAGTAGGEGDSLTDVWCNRRTARHTTGATGCRG